MKKILFAALFCGAVVGAFAQHRSSIGIAAFEAAEGIDSGSAAAITQKIIAELESWGTLVVLADGQAETAEFIVRGKIEKQGAMTALSALTIEAKSRKTLTETKEQAAGLNDISIFSFCAKLTERVPFPNYLLGKWQAVINLPDTVLACVMEFRSDRTVRVERYDTWERRQSNTLKYEGRGRGNYSYAGYARRVMSVSDGRGRMRESPVDATVNINVELEDTLPEYAGVLKQNALRLLFNEAKTAFEILNISFPCGRSFDGAAYPFESAAFNQFTKIQ